MKNPIAVIALLCALVFTAPCPSDAQTINNLGAGRGSVSGTDLFPSYQGALPAVRPSAAQIAAYVYGLMSGDATASGTGAVTFKTVNANVGSFGSATQCTAVTVNAKGVITAISATTCTPAVGSITGLGTGIATFLTTPSSANLLAALTTKTGTGNAVFGSAPTIDSLNATTAATLAFITGSTQCLQVNSSGAISGTGAACGGSGSTGANPTATAGPTAVNGSATTFMRSDGAPAIQLGTGSAPGLVQCGLGLTCTAGVAAGTVTQRNNTATSDTLLSTDAGTVVTENNASAVAVGIAVATTSGFGTGQYWTVKNKGAGVVTITPTTSTIDGALTLTLSQNQSIDFYSDGTNYWTLPGKPNGATTTIASGTAALGTSAIASGACATVVTVSATGVATTDTLTFGYNGDPTAVTGYGASASGAVLSIYPYPTANNVNVKVCNSTASSITPGSMTLNFRVVR
jgi:hypothetical protein